jgi:magnesium-transporting ATPase (P-type)
MKGTTSQLETCFLLLLLLLTGEDFLDGDWSTVIVGDILKVQIDEEFPADLVFLSSSDPQGKH